MFKRLNVTLVILLIVLVCQLYIIFMGLNPLNFYAAYSQRKEIEMISKLANVSPLEAKSYVEIGKTAEFADIDKIRKESTFNEAVYKDAKNGDKIIGYSDKMVIYRPSMRKLIYEGDTPGQKQQKEQLKALTEVVEQIKAAGHISKDSTETPQVAVVSDPAQLAKNAFYAKAAAGDAILSFGNEGVVVLYDANKKEIKNVAKVKLETEVAEEVTPTPTVGRTASPTPTAVAE